MSIDLSPYATLLQDILYRGECTVYWDDTFRDERTHYVRTKEKMLYENIPCLLSHSSADKSNTDTLPHALQDVRLFLNPKYFIPAGARIVVTQDGSTDTYAYTGVPNRFPEHIEYNLEKWKQET